MALPFLHGFVLILGQSSFYAVLPQGYDLRVIYNRLSKEVEDIELKKNYMVVKKTGSIILKAPRPLEKDKDLERMLDLEPITF